MLDDILEIALEMGGEVLEAVIEHCWTRRKARRRAKKEASRTQKAEEKLMAVQRKADPWHVRKPKLPWEE